MRWNEARIKRTQFHHLLALTGDRSQGGALKLHVPDDGDLVWACTNVEPLRLFLCTRTVCHAVRHSPQAELDPTITDWTYTLTSSSCLLRGSSENLRTVHFTLLKNNTTRRLLVKDITF